MKQYPSIPKEIIFDEKVIIFPKFDGSLFRAEYSSKKGFYKFGTKSNLISRSEPIFGEAIDLFLNEYNEDLSYIFKDKKYERVNCYSEFFGENSFAGQHLKEDHQVVLFDLDLYKTGLLGPEIFLDLTSNLNTAKPLWSGILDQELVDKIRNGLFEEFSFEGIVCKTVVDKQPEMFKIKTKKWLDKLKQTCGNNIEKFNELS